MRRLVLLLAPLALAAAGDGSLLVDHNNESRPWRNEGTGQSFLAPLLDGRGAILTWIDRRDGVPALFVDSRPAPRLVVSGESLVVSGVDVPKVLARDASHLAISYPWRHGEAGYDVRVVLSADSGRTWSKPIVPHRDGTATEHGFVSMVQDSGGVRLFWLDGRRQDESGRGATGLRTAWLGWDGALGDEVELDARVCDCCPTAATTADGSILVAYRDRDERERRDVALVSRAGGQWSAARTLHEDGWTIAGCPVNGPALDARGRRVAAAWFTAAGGRARVRARFSDDRGRTFGRVFEVSGADPIGHVGVLVVSDGFAIVTWLERGPRTWGELRAAHVTDRGVVDRVRIATLFSLGKLGVPHVARAGAGAVVAWTQPDPLSWQEEHEKREPSRRVAIAGLHFGKRRNEPPSLWFPSGSGLLPPEQPQGQEEAHEAPRPKNP